MTEETKEKITIKDGYVNNNQWIQCKNQQAWVHDLNSPINSLIHAKDGNWKGKRIAGRYQGEILIPRTYADHVFNEYVMPMLVKAQRPVEMLKGEYHSLPQGANKSRKISADEVLAYPENQRVKVGYASLRHGSELAKVDPRWQPFAAYSVLRLTRSPKIGVPEIFVVDQQAGDWRQLDAQNANDIELYRATFVPGVAVDFSFRTYISATNNLMFSISKIFAQTSADRVLDQPTYQGSFKDPTEAPAIVNPQSNVA